MTDLQRDKFRKVVLKMSADGSHTLFVPGLNEHYHSVHGAIRESMHIFIGAGLLSLPVIVRPLDILEIGFGTGLNALLTCLEAGSRDLEIRYTSIEKYPLPDDITNTLNYPDLTGAVDSEGVFRKIHRSPWNKWTVITNHFRLNKREISLHDYNPLAQEFDLVYFDAFGPDVQPEMWTAEVFRKISGGLKRGGMLITYSTKGDVKRNLRNAGFAIEKLPGPPGKREILRAVRL